MSVKRITNPVEFGRLIDDLYSLFLIENTESGHQLLAHNPETIKASYGHPAILTWDVFVWGHEENEKFDAGIIFINDKNAKFGEQIFTEFLWLSKNPKVGYKLFREAIKFAKSKKFKYVSMSTVVKHPSHERVKSFYTSMGFLKDSETYICKL